MRARHQYHRVARQNRSKKKDYAVTTTTQFPRFPFFSRSTTLLERVREAFRRTADV